MTDDSMYARISRIESDIDHIKEIIDPLPLSVNNALQKQAEISERLAVSNERIATHLEESKRSWAIIESLQKNMSDINDRFHYIDKSIIGSIEIERARINSIMDTIDLFKKTIIAIIVSLTGFVVWVIQKWIESK